MPCCSSQRGLHGHHGVGVASWSLGAGKNPTVHIWQHSSEEGKGDGAILLLCGVEVRFSPLTSDSAGRGWDSLLRGMQGSPSALLDLWHHLGCDSSLQPGEGDSLGSYLAFVVWWRWRLAVAEQLLSVFCHATLHRWLNRKRLLLGWCYFWFVSIGISGFLAYSRSKSGNLRHKNTPRNLTTLLFLGTQGL